MPEMSCPSCQTLRAPNAVYCHVCGHVYDGVSHLEPTFQAPLLQITEHRMSFGTAVTIGAGLAVGALVIGLIGTVLSGLLFASIVNALMQALSRFGS
jgi:hypothetical protein